MQKMLYLCRQITKIRSLIPENNQNNYSMKRIFFFFAAVLFAATMSAIGFNDGTLIKIGTTIIEETNCGNVISDVLISGHITYDHQNRILRMYNASLKSSTVAPLMYIGGTDNPITIEVYNTCTYDISTAGGNCLELETPVTFAARTTYAKVSMSSSINRGIFTNSDITIQDGVNLYVTAASYAIIGTYKDSKLPKLYVKGSECYAFGYAAAFDDFGGVEMEDAKWHSASYNWDDANHCLNDGIIKATEGQIDRADDVHYLYFHPDMIGSFEGGEHKILQDGSQVTNPYKTTAASTILQLNVDMIDGFNLLGVNGYIGQPLPLNVTLGTGDEEYTTAWTYVLQSTKPWYVVDKNAKLQKLDKIVTTPVEVGEVDKLQANNFTYGYGSLDNNGDVDFIFASAASSTEQSIKQQSFSPTDPASAQTPSIVINKQSKYNPIYAMAVNPMNNRVFYLAKNTVDSKYELLVEDPNVPGSFKKVISLTCSEEPIAMTITTDGYLYYLEKDTYNAKLHYITFGFGSYIQDIVVGSTGEAGINNSVNSNCLAYDPASQELIWLRYDGGSTTEIQYIDIKTGLAYKVADHNLKPRAFFQLTPIHKLTVEPGNNIEFEKGMAMVGAFNTSGYFAEGSQITLSVWPSSGCHFVKWQEDESTEATHTITMGDHDMTYTAIFAWDDPEIEDYPVSVNSTRIHSKRLRVNGDNAAGFLNDGQVYYNPDTRVLTLDNAKIKYGGTVLAVGTNDEVSEPITINLVGTNELVCNASNGVIFDFKRINVTFTGSGTLTTEALNNSSAMILTDADVTFNGTQVKLQANGRGIAGHNTEVVAINGANMSIQGGGVGSILGLSALELDGCTMTAPVGAEFKNNCVEVSGAATKDAVKFTSDKPQIVGIPFENGTGSFTISDGTTTYTDMGWFDASTDVTITAVPADGFEFLRWEHNTEWGDEAQKDKWLGSTITVSKTAGFDKYTAIFYYVPESDVTWYGVHNDKFISFEMTEGASYESVATAPLATNIEAGDYHDGIWEWCDNSDLLAIPFGGLTDKEDLPDKDNIDKLAESWGFVPYDMSYDLSSSTMYATTGCDLYTIDYENKKAVLVGTFYKGTTTIYAKAIAVDADGTIYILANGSPGRLYRVIDIDYENKEISVDYVGLESGMIGKTVETAKQSLAFDHVTGELFWGAPDYIRVINTETGHTNICCDLGMKKGSQGYVYSLHCMDEFASVSAKVDTDCKGMGTVSVNTGKFGEKSSASVLVRTKATITAKPAEGYKFVYWKYGKKTIDKDSYSFFVGGSASYTAVFEEDDMAIDQTQATPDAEKIIRNGQLLVIKNGNTYNALGELVK